MAEKIEADGALYNGIFMGNFVIAIVQQAYDDGEIELEQYKRLMDTYRQRLDSVMATMHARKLEVPQVPKVRLARKSDKPAPQIVRVKAAQLGSKNNK